VNKENIRELGSDIRYISAANFVPASDSEVLRIPFGSWQMYLLYGCPLIIAALLFIIFRKRIRENADIIGMRKRQANSVARKRLKTAKKLLSEQKKEQFFEEIERASLQYLSDRLSIPTADLNKETITSTLRDRTIDETLIERTNRVLSDAAFARYAPAMGIKPEELYAQTEQLINDLEDCKL
jgi:hypothetical protein